MKLWRAIREAALLAALAALPAIVSGAWQLKWQPPVPLREGEVSVATAQLWGASVLWVDARAREKFERQRIPGAVLLNPEEWEQLVPRFLDAWEVEKAIVVYGEGPGDDAATSVAHRLKEELKLESVWILQGGWRAWPQ
jgi:rhodanese-related sulfurtransferase